MGGHQTGESDSDRPVFWCTDDELESLFVDVTPRTATEVSARAWLECRLIYVSAERDVLEVDVSALRCVTSEYWTTDGQPAAGPAPGVRHLWRFDLTGALVRSMQLPFELSPRPGLPQEAIDTLEEHWRAGRISNADHDRLRLLVLAEDAAIRRYAARNARKPKNAPRLELRDDELYAVQLLMDHAVRLLAPLVNSPSARRLLLATMTELDEGTTALATDALGQLRGELDSLPDADSHPDGRHSR
jgi:hypothetical protein